MDEGKGRIGSIHQTVVGEDGTNHRVELLKQFGDCDADGVIAKCADLVPAYRDWAQRRYAIPHAFAQGLKHLRLAGANATVIEDMARMALMTNDATMMPPSVMARASVPFIAARKYDVPFWCVDAHLLEELENTTPPDKWEVNIPFQSGYFILPKALPNGVRVLAWTRVNKDTDLGVFANLIRGDFPDDIDTMFFTAVTPDGASVFSHTGVKDEVVDFSTLDGAPFATATDATGMVPQDTEPNEGDWYLVEKTPRLLANLLAVLTMPGFSDESNHRIVGRAKMSAGARAGQKKKKIKVDKWGVRILRDPVPPVRGTENTGTGSGHASPKVHWRRGHWHTVLHGKGRLKRKLKWFRPTMVGARNDDTEKGTDE